MFPVPGPTSRTVSDGLRPAYKVKKNDRKNFKNLLTFSTMLEIIKGFLRICCPFPFSNSIPTRTNGNILGHMLYLADIFELFLSLHLFLSFLLAFSFINKNDNYNNDYTWVLRIPEPDTPVSYK